MYALRYVYTSENTTENVFLSTFAVLPVKKQPPGLELGTRDWQSKNRTARPHKRPLELLVYGIYNLAFAMLRKTIKFTQNWYTFVKLESENSN